MRVACCFPKIADFYALPLPSPFFLSHFCLSLLSSFSSPLPLYIFFLQFFIPLPSHPFYAYFIPLTLLRYLYPASPSATAFLFTLCYLILSFPLSLHHPLHCLTSSSFPSSFPSPLTFLRIPSYFPQLAPSAFPVSFPRLVFLLCFSACLYCVSSQQQQQDV